MSKPGVTPEEAIVARSPLGILSGSDDDFAHGLEIGTITFEKIKAPEPVLLYFRYSPEGYRLYLRSGAHIREGVYCDRAGMVIAKPIGALDPTLWTLRDEESGLPVDILVHTADVLEVSLCQADGAALYLHHLYPIGGFLASLPGTSPEIHRLRILERGVDWLDADS